MVGVLVAPRVGGCRSMEVLSYLTLEDAMVPADRGQACHGAMVQFEVIGQYYIGRRGPRELGVALVWMFLRYQVINVHVHLSLGASPVLHQKLVAV